MATLMDAKIQAALQAAQARSQQMAADRRNATAAEDPRFQAYQDQRQHEPSLMAAQPPNWRQWMADKMAGGLSYGKPDAYDRRVASALMGTDLQGTPENEGIGLGAIDFVPGAGNLLGAADTADAYNRGDPLGTGLGALAIFAGPMAKTADRVALKTAQKMAGEGATRDAIWNATGWFNQHGDWKYEIPDDKSHLWSSARSDIAAGNERKLGQPGTFSHEQLFDAYPALRGTKLNNRVYGDNLGTQYPAQPHQLAGTIALKERFPPDMHSTLLHEVQHEIQDIENFARGGQPGEPIYDNKLYDAAILVQNRMQYTGESLPEAVAFISKHRKIPPMDLGDTAGRYSQEELKRKLQETSPYERYKRIAGETEARNVQERYKLKMTPEDRKAIPPWMTQEIPDEKQMVRRPSLMQMVKP